MCFCLNKITIPYIAALLRYLRLNTVQNQRLKYMLLQNEWNAVWTSRMWMRFDLGFCDMVDVCLPVLFVVLVSVFLWPCAAFFSTSEMCVSWGPGPVGGCSACLPVPHSSSATSHAHKYRAEESTHSSPAHSDPVVHSPRRSELENCNIKVKTDFYKIMTSK